MSDLIFRIKKGDTSKPLRFHLKRTTTSGTADVDLSGATVVIDMRERNSRAQKIDGQSCNIDVATEGKGSYDLSASEVDTPGTYDAELLVTYADTTKETFPEAERIVVEIYEDIE